MAAEPRRPAVPGAPGRAALLACALALAACAALLPPAQRDAPPARQSAALVPPPAADAPRRPPVAAPIAAAPAAGEQPAAPPAAGEERQAPPELVGLDAAALRALLGRPAFAWQQPGAAMWRYDGDRCALFAFLHGGRVDHVEIHAGAAAWRADCLRRLLAQPS